jgi:Family of unknown function (DUF6163)
MRFEGLTPPPIRPAPGLAQVALTALTRLLGVVALGCAVLAMARMVGLGFAGFEPARFDLITALTRFGLLLQLVLCAAAGLGLWALAQWGGVLWFIALTAMVVMHVTDSPAFGVNIGFLSIIVLLTALQAVLALILYFKNSRNSQPR